MWLFTVSTITFFVRPAQPQGLSINAFLSVPSGSVIYLSDFNITSSGSSAQIFSLAISSTPASSVTLEFIMSSAKYNADIIEAKTDPFDLGPEGRTFDNRLFGSGTAGITIDYLRFNTQIANELQNAILRTGRLPDDTYTILLRLASVDNPVNSVQQTLPLEISNPTTLSLVSPGSNAGSGECYELYTTLPLFQWDSNADQFEITICEQLPTNGTPEDVMQNRPRVQARLINGVHFTGKPSFLYPTSGVLPLQEGHTYYWQVAGIVNSPSGEIRLPSEIWCFKLAELGGAGANYSLQQILSLLSGIGGGEIEALFASGGALEGFSPTGVILLDGKRVDISGLVQVVNQLKNGSKQVKGITVE
jgi:hypothetical protein